MCAAKLRGRRLGRWAVGILAGASLVWGVSASALAQATVDKTVASKASAVPHPTSKAAPASHPSRSATKPAEKPGTVSANKPSSKSAVEPVATRAPDVDTSGLTRLQVCQLEIQGAKGNRQALLRACLNRRLKGEHLAGRDCKRQAAMGAKSPSARAQAVGRCGGVPQKMKDGKPVGANPKLAAPKPVPKPAAGEKI